jgi:hypothetical protein
VKIPGRGQVQEILDPLSEFIQAFHAQGHGDALHAAKEIRGHREGRAFNAFEKQRFSTAGALGFLVREPADFKNGGYVPVNDAQLPFTAKGLQKGLHVSKTPAGESFHGDFLSIEP